MIITEPSYEIIRPQQLDRLSHKSILRLIERAARTCYKSENLMKEGSYAGLVRRLIKSGHEAMLEHATMTVLFVVDRAVANEMVRHRIASFAQESTRYCNYEHEKFGGQITFIRPYIFEEGSPDYETWKQACSAAEHAYFELLENNTPQWARDVLPLCTKTEIVVTMNLREWRHFFLLRASDATGKAHPQMKQVTVPLLKQMQEFLPEIFDDIPLPEGEVHG